MHSLCTNLFVYSMQFSCGTVLSNEHFAYSVSVLFLLSARGADSMSPRNVYSAHIEIDREILSEKECMHSKLCILGSIARINLCQLAQNVKLLKDMNTTNCSKRK